MHTKVYGAEFHQNKSIDINAVKTSLWDPLVYMGIEDHGANGVFNSTTYTKAAGAIVAIATESRSKF